MYREFVAEGNLIAARTFALVLMASSLGLRWLLEQPSGSAMFRLPRAQQLFTLVQAP